MKVKLNQSSLIMLKYIIEATPWTKPDLAKALFELVYNSLNVVYDYHNQLITDNEVEVEIDNPERIKQEQDIKDLILPPSQAKDIPQKLKVMQVPQEKEEELYQKDIAFEVEVDFGAMLYAPVKLAVEKFPTVYTDPKTGAVGIKWYANILAYEQLKEKFTQ